MIGHRSFAELRAAMQAERNKPWNRFKRFIFYRPRARVRSLRENIRLAYQRVTRGWDERAYWATEQWLCESLGGVLEYTAPRLHGHPEGTEYEEWVAQHVKAAKALLAYAGNDGAYGENRDTVIEEAQAALHWAADNLPHLWD